MNKVLTLLFVLILITSCKEKNKLSQLNDLRQITWITGRWRLEDKPIIESWNRTSDSVLSGISISQEAGDTKVLELLKIFEDKGIFYYSANVAKQNNGETIYFPMTFYNESTLVFENPKHDFPQSIMYKINDKKDVLTVKLSGKGNSESLTFLKAD